MAWLVHPVATFISSDPRPATEARILAQLQRLGIPAEQRQGNPSIVAEYVMVCLNLGLWRCFSDRLEFGLEEVEAHKTRVTINAVPSFSLGLDAAARKAQFSVLLTALQSGGS